VIELYQAEWCPFAFLDRFDPPPTAAEHRARYHEHADARRRDTTGKLLERAAPIAKL
jgi:hypothetical protein